MTKDQEDSMDNKTNPVMASVAGVVIGAGLGATGALILNDKKNRAKVKEVLNHFRDQVTEYSGKKKEEMEKSLKEGELKARKIGEIAKDSLSQGTIDGKGVTYAK